MHTNTENCKFLLKTTPKMHSMISMPMNYSIYKQLMSALHQYSKRYTHMFVCIYNTYIIAFFLFQ